MRSQSIAIGIASTGRPDTLSVCLNEIALQRRAPDRILISIHHESDFDAAAVGPLPVPVETLIGPKGSCCQRNLILDALPVEDIILFLDDDFIMNADYLANLETLFRDDPSIAMATGHVIQDGVLGPGLSADEARRIIAADEVTIPGTGTASVVDVYNAYGCNMAARLHAVRAHGARFDEQLPLYGWLEDIDFSRQVAAGGRSVKSSALRGVHLGVKHGRTSGVRFGYSQIANPVYLSKKGSMDRRHSVKMMTRNVLANLGKAAFSEPWIDRRGRLYGNLIAFGDIVGGRLNPQRILELGEVRHGAR